MMSAKMKKTEIGLIPDDWDVAKVGDISDTYAGGTPLRSNKEYYGGNIRWVKSGEVNLGEIFDTKEKITESGLKNSSAKQIPENTVLVAMYGATAGKVGILRVKGTANQAVLAVPNNKGKFNYKFMYYLLSSKTNKLVNSTQGTGQPNLSKFLADNLEIQIPPITDQEAIAEVLSTLDKRLDIVERESQRVERLKVGLMRELFDGKKWKLQKITDIFEIETGTTPSTKEKEYWINGTVNWITPADMNNLNNTLDLPESRRKITQKALKEVNLTLMPIGSIVISTRAPVGYIGLVKKELTFNQGCKGLIPKDASKVNTVFYAYYLLSLQEYLNNISGGSTFKELSKDSLCKLEMPVPSISEQNEIANILLTVDKKLSIQQSKKSKLESIKKSLMNDLLTGKKRVKVD